MKTKLYLLLLGTALFFSCNNHHEKEAQVFLQRAQTALEAHAFSEAKLQLDSIKVMYPKAFETRKAANDLLLEVKLKEQQVSLHYIDSMLVVQKAAVQQNKKTFRLEKNAKYQEEGNFFYPTQIDSKNLNRTYLRAQVSERGKFSLTAVYHDRRYLNHTQIKVQTKDGSYSGPIASSNTYKSHLGRHYTEKCDYTGDTAKELAKFIALNHKKTLNVQFISNRKTVTKTMRRSDALAVMKVFRFAQLLDSIQTLEQQKEKAQRYINFLTRKIEE